MTAELVRVTTELHLTGELDCYLPNKRALIAALHRIGDAIGALPAEVARVIDYFEERQRDSWTRQGIYSRRSKERISQQAALHEWRPLLPSEARRAGLPEWLSKLHFQVERENGGIVLKGLRYENMSYGDLAVALGIDPEPPAEGCSVQMVLPRVHESRRPAFFSEGLIVPLDPFMRLLTWFFEEPHVTMDEDERRQYAEERNLALDGSRIEYGQFQVAPYAEWLDSSERLAAYLTRRFSAGSYGGERIEFSATGGDEDIAPERKHLLLWGDEFWAHLDIVHPTVPDMSSQNTPSVMVDNTHCHCLDVRPCSWGSWEAEDDPMDVGLARLTFGFNAVLPYALARKGELQQFADTFAAKLKELFEPVMQEMQTPCSCC